MTAPSGMKGPIDRRHFLKTSSALAAVWSACAPARQPADPAAREWQNYGGDAGASRYSPLDQINRTNVSELKVAWTHRTGDAIRKPATTIECTPIVVDGRMYISTAQLRAHALDAATGRKLWSFDPQGGKPLRRSPGVNRGVTYWQNPTRPDDRRIFLPDKDMLYSIDAGTGKLTPGFGQDGVIDLKQDFDHDMTGLSFNVTSPVVAYRDLIIVGGGGGEGPYPEAPGHIRGYDAATGKRRWIFHTTPRPGQFGNDTWEGDSWKTTGGTNNWGGMSLDPERGWVFASVGSPAFDFYGGNRKGANLFGNCVLALDASTGERQWHFQTVHHDVWDYDLPCQPALITMTQGGRTFEAVVQPTKMGMIFFFDRETGKPVFPVEERPMPASDVPGEELWPTQPFPVKPPPLCRQGFMPDQITDITPEAHAFIKEIYDRSRVGALYTPPSLQGTIIHPGFRGGALWGGCSYDPAANRLFVNTSEWTNRITLAPAREDQPFDYALPERAQLSDPDKYPVIKPPWGYLTAIDLDSGDFAWRVVAGRIPELEARGITGTGSPMHGGTVATAGGLIFVGGSFDKKFRAYDSSNGRVVWEHQLNAGGFATPSTYEAEGRQYVVIAAGGGQAVSNSGDEFVAFALA